jgi:hypothetical protein
MSHINNLLNYYIENDYLNLNNNITLDDVNLLIDSINKYNIIINNINIPKDFKYYDLIKEKLNNTVVNFIFF